MKILQVGLGNNPGGMEAFVMNYFRELSRQGVSFDFVSMYGTIAYEKEILELGGRVFYVPNIKKDYFGYIKAFRKLLSQEKYHSHNASAPGIVRKLMDGMNRPRIKHYVNEKFACSEKAGRWLFGDKAFERGEVTLVANAIETDKYGFSESNRRKIREKLGISGDALVVGHVGRFQVQKNHEAILRIFHEIQRKEPAARLCLIGDGELKEQIQEQAKKAGVLDKIIFTGVCQDVERYLSAMDVFLFPSLFEGLPFTLLEAQANGLPCVISDQITGEAVLSRENVTMISLAESPEKWAKAVFKMKEAGRIEREEAARRLAEAGFDIHKEGQKLMLLYGR